MFEGRLIRFDELPFAASIRSYFATHVAATHFFAPEALAQALAARRPGAPLTVADTSGDVVSLDERETIGIDVSERDQVKIGLPRERFPTEGAARAALTSRGGEILSALGAVRSKPRAGAPESGPLSATPEPPQRWTFVVRFPPATAQAALDAIGNLDRAVDIRDARQTRRRQAGGRLARRATRAAASSSGRARGRSAASRRPPSPPSTRWRRW